LAFGIRRNAALDIAALSTCLLGLVGVLVLVLRVKAGAEGVPRLAYLGFLAMVCAPFLLAFSRMPKVLYLIPPVIAVFILYPITSPHGIVYYSDPVFNFSFTDQILASGFWVPGRGNAFARAYSFYPIGNVFIAYVTLTVGLPPAQAYMWIEPLLRLLALPATVFSIANRLFGGRTAVLALFFYLGTASILFNVPVQQGMGVVFVGLSLLALVVLTQVTGKTSRARAQIVFALVGAGIVMTHHLSSYVFAGWFAALAVLVLQRRYQPSVGALRFGLLLGYYVAFLGLYVLTFTYPIFQTQYGTLDDAIAGFIAPEEAPAGTQGAALGRTFSPFETAWLAGSVLVLLLLALATIQRYRATGQNRFAVANGIVASVVTLVSLPLIVTPLNFVPLRISEFANFFIAPLAATTLLRWSRIGPSNGPLLPTITRNRSWMTPAGVLVVSALLFMGGNLAPLTMRLYFESPAARTTDSPLFLGSDAVRSADWARAHYGGGRVWGDQLAVDTFSGFGGMPVDFGSARVFQNTTVDALVWSRVYVGDYVIVDRWMTILRPNFLHEPLSAAPLSAQQVEKFATDRHFALVYQDESFSVYRVIAIGP